MKLKGLVALVAMIALSACAGQELNRASSTAPAGTAFDNALSAGYLQLAKDEYAEGDYGDSDYFAQRSLDAGTGLKVIMPPEPTARTLPESSMADVEAAYKELVAALDASARTRVPETAADAQVAYECWIQELEENFQPDHIAACRDRLMALLVEMKPAAPAAKAAPPKGGLFKVYFDTGSSELDGAANDTIAEAAALAMKFDSARIAVSGYTDRAGSVSANEVLAKKRADVVAAALRARGIAQDAMRVKSYGERFPDVLTGDNVAEPKNRRVEISVAP